MARLLAARRGDQVQIVAVDDPADPDHLNESGGLLPGPHAALAGPTFGEWLDATFPRRSSVMAQRDLPDEALVRQLPGELQSRFAEVNGTRLHYVIGGEGRPLVLLPGCLQTWWAFHKVMPALARRHRVIAVDIRGMGGSARPESGYDEKTMARDVRELARHLGYEEIDVVGHDIGAHVAYSYAANHAEAARKVVLIDATHATDGFERMPLLPRPGQQVDPGGPAEGPPYLWWWAFNQVRGLPERLLEGRMRLLLDWHLDYAAVSPEALDEQDRTIYAGAHADAGAMRAGNAWYQAFLQDIADERGTAGWPSLFSRSAAPGRWRR